MDFFGNFLKSLSETLGPPATAQNSNNTRTEGGEFSLPPCIPPKNESKARRMNAIKNQAREDDDEEFQARGRRPRNSNSRPSPGSPNNPGFASGAAGAILGLSALAIGGYAAYSYLSKEKKLSVTRKEVEQKLKEMEEDIKEMPVIGFDCQWSQNLEDQSKRNKIAVLQIATWHGKVLLIQMNKLYTFSDELKTLLRNPMIIKAGIETLKDARYLLEDYGLIVKGTFDLRFLAEDTGHRPEGLAKLANKVLDIELTRDWELVASDWNKDPLDEDQINYAEKAVKASIDIFKTLIPFAVTNVNRNEVLSYCYEHKDRQYIFKSQDW